ncbi:MAG: putative abductin-like protein, partial [Myxococcaceae bacterium]|nr:putative abductin-like protein [Myxococcaceae bacterium]
DRAARDARRVADANAAADRAVAAVANAMSHNRAEFAALTGVNDTGHGTANDALIHGGLMAGTREDLEHVGGITSATGQPGVHRNALAMAGPPGGGRRLGEGGAVRSTGDDIGTGPEVVHTVVRYTVAPQPIETNGGDGVVDADTVARLIRGQLGGIRSCYERELRQNPALAGRLDVNFTLGASGRITRASTAGLAASPNVGTCVTGRLRGLVFPIPQGGSVEFTFPFTFTPGS